MLYTESVTDARPLTAPWYVMPKKPAAVPMTAAARCDEERSRFWVVRWGACACGGWGMARFEAGWEAVWVCEDGARTAF